MGDAVPAPVIRGFPAVILSGPPQMVATTTRIALGEPLRLEDILQGYYKCSVRNILMTFNLGDLRIKRYLLEDIDKIG